MQEKKAISNAKRTEKTRKLLVSIGKKLFVKKGFAALLASLICTYDYYQNASSFCQIDPAETANANDTVIVVWRAIGSGGPSSPIIIIKSHFLPLRATQFNWGLIKWKAENDD